MAQLLSPDEIDQIQLPEAQGPANERSLAGKFLSPEQIDSIELPTPRGRLSPEQIDNIPLAAPAPPAPSPERPLFRSVDTTVPRMRTTEGGPPLSVPEGGRPFDELEGPVSTTLLSGARTAGATLGASGKGVAAMGEDVLEAPAQIAGYQEPFRNLRSLGRVKSVGNLLGALEQEQPTPFEVETQQTTGIPRFARTAATTLAETEPRLAAGFALGAVGVPSSVAAALPMAVTDKGELDPVGAAVAFFLPGVQHAGEEVVAKTLARLPIAKAIVEQVGPNALRFKKVVQNAAGVPLSNDTFRKFLEQGGGYLFTNAYLAAADSARNYEELQHMSPDQRQQWLLDLAAQNLAPALLGFLNGRMSRTMERIQPELIQRLAAEVAKGPPPAPVGKQLPPATGAQPGEEANANQITGPVGEAPTGQPESVPPVPGGGAGPVQKPPEAPAPQTPQPPQGGTGPIVTPPPPQPPATGPQGQPTPGVVAPKPKSAADFAIMPAVDFGAWTKATSYGPGDAEKIAASFKPEDRLTLETARDKARAEANAMLPQLQAALDSGNEALANRVQLEFGSISLKAQTLNELLQGMPTPKVKTEGTTKPNPTPAEVEAGNYPKRSLKIEGLPEISIETEAGGIRKSKPGAPPWQVQMPVHYGYFKGTKDNTGEHVDVYVGPNPAAPHALVMDQHNAETGAYDEPKVFIGFNNSTDAVKAYHGSFSDNKATRRMGAFRALTLPELNEWLKNPVPASLIKTGTKPAPGETKPAKTETVPEGELATTLRDLTIKKAGAAVNKLTADDNNLATLHKAAGLAFGELIPKIAPTLTDSQRHYVNTFDRSAFAKSVLAYLKRQWAGEIPPTKPRKAGDLEGMSEDELDKLLDEAEGSTKAPKAPKAPTTPKAPKPLGTSSRIAKLRGMLERLDKRRDRLQEKLDTVTEAPAPWKSFGDWEDSQLKIAEGIEKRKQRLTEELKKAEAAEVARLKAAAPRAPKGPSLRPEKPKPAKPASREIGKNSKGEVLYEDQNGVRYRLEGHIRISEPVQMIPTRGPGGKVVYETGTGDRTGTEWEVVRETITPAEDKAIGTNADGEQLYERADGSVYRMHAGKPDFGGDLSPVKSVAEIAAAAAKLGVKGIDEAIKGLHDLFGGGGKVGMPLLGAPFDEEAYKKAKPHFQQAYENFKRAGRTLGEFLKYIFDEFGARIRPYIKRFIQELQAAAKGISVPAGAQQPTEGGGGAGGIGGTEPATPGPTGEGEQAPTAPEGQTPGVQPGVPQTDEGPAGAGGGPSSGTVPPVTGGLPAGQGPEAPESSTAPGGGTTTPPLPGQPPAPAPVPAPIPEVGQKGPRNLWFEQEHAPTGLVARVNANLDAVELVKKLEAEQRFPTDDERKVLAAWSGWGSFKELFNQGRAEKRDWDVGWVKRYGRAYDKLEKLLTPKEFLAAAESSAFAHYTSQEVIEPIWDLVKQLGFKGGRVLDPSAGKGSFAGFMPKDLQGTTQWTQIELEPITGKILAYLFPETDVRIQAFEDSKLPNGFFDLSISNVPFHTAGPGAEYPDLNLHNYFIARKLDKTKPGGLVVAITSAFTMEAQYMQRKFLVGKGQLVGAIRLPNNAFKGVAGTEVTTDILVFRKPDGKPFPAQKWENQITVQMGEKEAPINEYFAEHPEMVLGRNAMEGKLYGKGGYTVQPTEGALPEKLKAAIEKFPKDVIQQGQTTEEVAPSQTAMEDHTLMLDENGRVMEARGFKLEMPEWDSSSKTLVTRAKAYIGLRDALLAQYRMEGSPDTTDKEMEDNRKKLKKLYDAWVKAQGNLNENASKTRFLSSEPHYYTVLGLEKVKEIQDPKDPAKTLTVIEPADVLSMRVKRPDLPPDHVENATDALGVSLAYKGSLDIEFMKALTGLTQDQIESDLLTQGAVFKDPDSGSIEVGAEYLSGDVRDKLAKAIFAAKESDQFKRNVEALRAVIPETIPFERVSMDITARWTPLPVLNSFAEKMIGLPAGSVTFVPVVEQFAVKPKERWALSELAKTQWSTNDRSADVLLEHAMNFKRAEVTRTDSDGKSYVDEDATALANQMIKKMKEGFLDYIRNSKDTVPYRYFDAEAGQYRTEPLAIWDCLEREFNKKVNSFVDPQYDGSVLKLPGLSDFVRRTPHLVNAVMRAIMTGSAVFAHGVGSGKTFLQIIIAHELQRIGLAKKMAMVVKKSTMGQFRTSIERAYPGSKVLIPNESDFKPANRKKLIARIASGKWDFIVISHEQFKSIRPGEQLIREFFDEQIGALLQILHDQGFQEPDEKSGTRGLPPEVRNIVRKIRSLRKRLREHTDSIRSRQDTGLPWEDIGIDGLSVDESHNFKKIPIPTQMGNEIKGIPNDFSQRAVDLLVKVRNIQQKTNGRNVFFASGTPVSNTLAELWVQFHATNPNLLKAFNVETFDSFASTFAEVLQTFEFGWDQKFHDYTRMARFKNPVGLTMLTRLGMDVRMGNKELGLDVPNIKGGKPEVHIVGVTPAFQRWIQLLKDVSSAWNSLDPKGRFFNSWVPITTMRAGVAAAVDPRCIFPDAEDHPDSKVNQAVRQIIQKYHEGAEHRSTMMVFCDMYGTLNTSKLLEFLGQGPTHTEIEAVPEPGTPPAGAEDAPDTGAKDEADFASHLVGNFSVYNDIRAKLIAAGIPEHEIGIAIEHNTDAKREALFNKVRTGIVRILIGGTEKIGEGVDVPQRMLHQIHLDPPMQMTPAKYEQRLGRIIRQGNMFSPKGLNIPVEIHLWAQKFSMDAAIWQMMETKAIAILQALKGSFLGDTFDDPASDVTSTMAEMVAESTGDKRALQLVKLRTEVRDLSAEEGAYFRRGSELRRSIDEQSRAARYGLEDAGKMRKLAAAVTAATPNDEAVTLLHVRSQKRVTGKEDIEKWLKALEDTMKEAADKPGKSSEASLIFGENVRCRLTLNAYETSALGTDAAGKSVLVKGIEHKSGAVFYLGGPNWEFDDPHWSSSLSSIVNTLQALKRVPQYAESRAEVSTEASAKAESLGAAYTEQLNALKFDKEALLKQKREELAQLEAELLRGETATEARFGEMYREGGAISPPIHYRIISEMQRVKAAMDNADDLAAIARMRRNQLKKEGQNEMALGDAVKEADQADSKAFDLHTRLEDLQRRLAIVEKARLGAARAGALANLPYGRTPSKRGTAYSLETPEPAPGMTVSAARGIAELRRMLQDPNTALSPESRRVALALLDEPVMQDLDWSKLAVSIREALPGNAGGRANIGRWLIELAEGARPSTFPHEVFHFLYNLLPDDVRAQIDGLRKEELQQALLRIRSIADAPPGLVDLVGRMFTGHGVTSEDYIAAAAEITGQHPELMPILKDWYYLSSPEEYLAGTAGKQYSRSGFYHKDEGLFDRLVSKIREWLRGLLDVLRRFLGHKPEINSIINDLLQGKYRNTADFGTQSERVMRGDIEPPESPKVPEDTGSPDLDEEEMTTRRMGTIDRILGRETINPAFQERGKAHAAARFALSGLQVEEAPDGWFQLVDPDFDAEIEGRKLLKMVQDDIAKQQAPGVGQATGELGFLLNSIRLHMVGDDIDAFSPTLKTELYATTQGEASHRGIMLRALAAIQKSVSYVAMNVKTLLNRTYSDAFGGDFVRSVVSRIAEAFRDYFTETEIEAAIQGSNLDEFLQKAIRMNIRDQGNRVYRKAQGLLKPKGRKTLARLEADARVTEAVREILAQAAQQGIEPIPSPNKPLPPIEQLLLMIHPKTAEKIDALIAKAITDAARNAGIKQALLTATDDQERQELMDRFSAGEEPTDEQMEQGLDLPEFAHWKVIRDNLLDYNPVTTKLTQDLIRSDFRGTRFKKPTERPVDTRIDLEKLAKAPEAEVQRVLDGYLMNIEANMDVTHATDQTKAMVVSQIEAEIVKQLESARERVRAPLFAEPAARGVAPTPEQRLGALINAGLFRDPRLDIPAMVERIAARSTLQRVLPKAGDLVKQALDTPFYRQDQLPQAFAQLLTAKFNISAEQAANAMAVFQRAFEEKFREARKQALKQATESLTPQERRQAKPGKPLWQKVVAAANAGVFDSTEILRNIAQAKGWHPPTEEEVARLKDLAGKLQKLRQLTPAEIAEAGGDAEALRKAQAQRDAVTLEKRAALAKQVAATWARFTRPISWPGLSKSSWVNSWNNRQHIAAAINEFEVANMLLKVGFAFRLPIHIMSQLLVHIPTRALGQVWMRHAGGDPTPVWKDVTSTLAAGYGRALGALRPALASARAALAGRGESRNVDRLASGILMFERLGAEADAMAARGEWAKAAAARILGLARFSLRFVQAVDNFQGVPAEYGELDHQVTAGLRERGMSEAEIQANKDRILGALKEKHELAIAKAAQVLDLSGEPYTEAQLHDAAWDLVRSNVYEDIRQIGLPADDFRARNEKLRRVIAWQERTTTGPGGAVASFGKAMSAVFASAGLPLSFTRFANAVGTGINYSLMFTPAYALAAARVPGSEPSPWFETESDRYQRRVQAIFGTILGSVIFGAVLAGLIRVFLKSPTDKEERELWEAQGHRAGTLELVINDHEFIPISLTVGPGSIVAPYAASAGAVVDLINKRAKEQDKLDKEAAKHGLPAGKVRPIDATDVLSVAAQTAWGTLISSKALTGVVQSGTEYGVPNLVKTAAAYVSPTILGLPAYQEAMRAFGVNLDSKLAGFWDFLVPLPGSQARAVNMLGDPVGTPNATQRIFQTILAGTYPGIVDTDDAREATAYAALLNSGYRPPSIEVGKGYAIDGEYRPLNDAELSKFAVERGQQFKQALEVIGPNADAGMAKAAFQQANQIALQNVGVDITAEHVQSARGGGAAIPEMSPTRFVSPGVPGAVTAGPVGGGARTRSGVRGASLRSRLRGVPRTVRGPRGTPSLRQRGAMRPPLRRSPIATSGLRSLRPRA